MVMAEEEGSEVEPPVAASYPVSTRYWPSVERVIMPSLEAVPLAIKRLLEPTVTSGIGKV
jgi:hypothetical protein